MNFDISISGLRTPAVWWRKGEWRWRRPL